MKHIDKLLHFLTTFCITMCFSVINIWLGVGITLIMSILKELYDRKQQGNHFCWFDIIADILGICLAIAIYYIGALI